MIVYKTGTWGMQFLCRVSGSVYPKSTVFALPNAIVAALLSSTFREDLDNILNVDGVDTLWSGYTMVLGFLVVFRNNQAYSRFWEGATLIQQVRGEWFNSISSLIAFCTNKEDKRTEVDKFQNLLVRLMSMLYLSALQQVCDLKDDSLEIIDLEGIDQGSLHFLEKVPDRCEVILQWIQRLIVDNQSSGVLPIAPPILSRAFQELSRGVVNLNNARKIKDVPFPFPYAQMITFMLVIHWMITPVMACHYIKSTVWAAVLSFLVTSGFWSLLYIAAEIDQPFGDDTNDLPLRDMQREMNQSLITLLHPLAQKPPIYDFDSKGNMKEKELEEIPSNLRALYAVKISKSNHYVSGLSREGLSEHDEEDTWGSKWSGLNFVVRGSYESHVGSPGLVNSTMRYLKRVSSRSVSEDGSARRSKPSAGMENYFSARRGADEQEAHAKGVAFVQAPLGKPHDHRIKEPSEPIQNGQALDSSFALSAGELFDEVWQERTPVEPGLAPWQVEALAAQLRSTGNCTIVGSLGSHGSHGSHASHGSLASSTEIASVSTTLAEIVAAHNSPCQT